MLHEIIVPELAESTVEATVASWLKDGEIVSKGDIIELDTDKVSLEIVSPSNGTIKEVKKTVGDVVKVGEILGTIDDSGSAPSKESEIEEVEVNNEDESSGHIKRKKNQF